MGGPLAGSAAAEAKSSKKPPSQVAVAKRLVDGLRKASTPAARERAVLAIMRGLQVPVVSPSGRPIVATPEPNGVRGLALYPAELRALGGAFRRGPRDTLDDVAARLSKVDIKLDDERNLPAELMRQALVESAKAGLKSARTPSSLDPLLVRELGLRSPRAYDLAKNPEAARITLDPVAAWIVEADLVVHVLRKLPASTGRFTGMRSAFASSTTDECQKLTDLSEELQEKVDKQFSKSLGGPIQAWIGKYAAGKIADKFVERLTGKAVWKIRALPTWARKTIRTGVKAVKLAASLKDALHDMLIAYSVDVRALDELLKTHWGHDGPGEQMVFRVKVTMLDDYGDLLVKCGQLVGGTFPPPGPVEGVTIGWEQVQARLDPTEGTLDCGTLLCFSTTGEDGIARLTFTPNEELVPATGFQKINTGVVNGIAAYQSAADSGVVGQVAQFLTPKVSGTRWEVASHSAKLALKVSGNLKVTYHRCGGAGDSMAYSGQMPVAIAPDRTASGSGTLPFLPGTVIDRCGDEGGSVASETPGTLEILSLSRRDPPDSTRPPVTVTFKVVSPDLEVAVSDSRYHRYPFFEALDAPGFEESIVERGFRDDSATTLTSEEWPRGSDPRVVATREYVLEENEAESDECPRAIICRRARVKFELLDVGP